MHSNLPATVGTPLEDVVTPCLLLDLDAFEHNLDHMAQFVRDNNISLRAHAKCHKSADIARELARRGAIGICCQKVSEAEALHHAGVSNILVSNQVVNPVMINRMAAMAVTAEVSVCVDDLDNLGHIQDAAARHDATIGVLVEIDCGANRCGVAPGAAAVPLAQKAAASPNLKFLGLQAYQGAAQHKYDYAEREALVAKAAQMIRQTTAELEKVGLKCEVIAGGGTGTFRLDTATGLYTELECGSYMFMDADYGRVKEKDGAFISEFRNSLFIYTTVMSKTKPHRAICDAGLKAQSVDSGMPVIHGRSDVEYIAAADEHGVISDPDNKLRLGDRLKLIPSHCDPTVNVYDWYVGVRGGRVEQVFPVTARGMNL